MAARPDGATHWTSPTGHTYVTTPGAAVLFPHWNIHTEVPPPRPISLLHDEHRGTMMPTRARTRTQDRDYRINAERTRNATELALARTAKDATTNTPTRPASTTDWLLGDRAIDHPVTNNNDPPPF